MPAFLKYAYVFETPMLLEGSILKNLLLAVEPCSASCLDLSDGVSCKACNRVSNEEAWEVARLCGLDKEYLHAPETFSVGKNGRNLPLVQRQALCLARGILSDADVLMLHKPTAMLPSEHADRVLRILHEFTSLGGVSGILRKPSAKAFGSTFRDFLTGTGRRTVILALSDGAVCQKISGIVERTISCVAAMCEEERRETNDGLDNERLARLEVNHSLDTSRSRNAQTSEAASEEFQEIGDELHEPQELDELGEEHDNGGDSMSTSSDRL